MEHQASLLDRLTRLSTSCISDALDMLGIDGGCEQIRPIVPGRMVVGPAFTLQYEPVEAGEPAPAGEFIDEVPAGSVIVIANGGRSCCTVWGDLLTFAAIQKGIAGTVIDGCCRDVARIVDLGYPVFAKGVYMKSGKNRVKLVGKQIPVSIGKTVVHPGDVVCGDDAGVIVIPQAVLSEVAARAEEIEAMERNIVSELRQGVPMMEARRKHRYNHYALAKKQE